MRRNKADIQGQLESADEREIRSELAELQAYLNHYSVKYPDESTISQSIEQLRIHVPRKKQPLQILLSQMPEALGNLFPFYRFTSVGLFLFGSLLLPSKLY